MEKNNKNFHSLPCGTVIPNDGLECWVRHSEDHKWTQHRIIANAYGRLVSDTLEYWREYSLTDPDIKKTKLIRPLQLLGKFIHGGVSVHMITHIENGKLYNGIGFGRSVEDYANQFKGWSDTPMGEIKSFFTTPTNYTLPEEGWQIFSEPYRK